MTNTQDKKTQKIRLLEYAKEQYRKAKNLKSFVLETVKENKGSLLFGMGCTGLAGLIGSGVPVLGEYAVNMIGSTGAATAAAVAAGTVYSGASVLRNGLDYLGDTVSSWFYRRMKNRMSKEMLDKVFNMPPLVHSQKGDQYLASLADTVATESQTMLQNVFGLVYFSPLVFASLGIVAAKAPSVAPYIIGVTATKIGISTLVARKLRPALNKLREKENIAKANRQDMARNYRFLQSHRQVKNAIVENDRANEDILKDDKSLDKKWMIYDWAMRALDTVTMGILCAKIVPDLMQTQNAGVFVSVAGAAATALGCGTTLAYFWRQIKQSFFKYQDSVNALKYEKAFELQKGQEKTDALLKGHIEFHDVSVAYPLEKKMVFENLNLKLHPGSLTVLAGKSGVGKTTLIRLLQHMMEPTSGHITIDGYDVSKLDRDTLFRNVAIVHQEQKFLERKSILENLRLVRPDITDEEIFSVMKELDLHDDIVQKKEGYEAKPQTLSGGQQQRLGIAQALLKGASIVFLDEPTANLDPQNKALVFKNIKKRAEDQTIVVISHDLPEMAMADRLIYLEKGKIVEDGSPAELLHRKGPFRKFYQRQKKTMEAPLYKLLEENGQSQAQKQNAGNSSRVVPHPGGRG